MLKKFSLIAVFAAVFGFSLQAAPWIAHTSKRAPHTLIVVSNSKTPRLMAATIKGLTAQPYLIMNRDNRAFMVIRKTMVEVPAGKLDVYINDLNPRRVVIIGDERFVTVDQERQLRKINMKRIPVMRVYGGDWGRIAEELDDMLNIGNLAREFRRNYAKQYMSDPRLKSSSLVKDVKKAAPAVAPAGQSEAVKNEPAAANQEQEEEVPISEPQEL